MNKFFLQPIERQVIKQVSFTILREFVSVVEKSGLWHISACIFLSTDGLTDYR